MINKFFTRFRYHLSQLWVPIATVFGVGALFIATFAATLYGISFIFGTPHEPLFNLLSIMISTTAAIVVSAATIMSLIDVFNE